MGGGVFVEDVAEALGVDVVERVELVDFGLVSGDGVGWRVVSAGEFVEVGAGVDGLVDGGGVEGGRGLVVGLGGAAGVAGDWARASGAAIRRVQRARAARVRCREDARRRKAVNH